MLFRSGPLSPGRTVTYVGYRNRLDDRRQQINEDNESHRETAETTKPVQENKLAQVMHRRVDPTATLGQQNLPLIRSRRERLRISHELRLVVREMLQ